MSRYMNTRSQGMKASSNHRTASISSIRAESGSLAKWPRVGSEGRQIIFIPGVSMGQANPTA